MAMSMSKGPTEILQLLLGWDTAGVRFEEGQMKALKKLYCYLPDEECMSEEPGWDMANVLVSYEITPILERQDSGVFEIAFDQIGSVDAGGFSTAIVSARDTVHFKRLGGQWRIVGVESQMMPHLSKAAAYRRWSKAVPDSAALKAQLGSK
jgi:hypothetical protein